MKKCDAIVTCWSSFKTCATEGAREITRLDITMQHIFSQIIDSYNYFASKVQWLLLQKLHLETKQKLFFLQIKFLVRSLQEVLFLSLNFCGVKISHDIQPSNLSSALLHNIQDMAGKNLWNI